MIYDMRHCGLWQDMACWIQFNVGKTPMVTFDQSNKTGVIDEKMNGSVLEE